MTNETTTYALTAAVEDLARKYITLRGESRNNVAAANMARVAVFYEFLATETLTSESVDALAKLSPDLALPRDRTALRHFKTLTAMIEQYNLDLDLFAATIAMSDVDPGTEETNDVRALLMSMQYVAQHGRYAAGKQVAAFARFEHAHEWVADIRARAKSARDARKGKSANVSQTSRDSREVLAAIAREARTLAGKGFTAADLESLSKRDREALIEFASAVMAATRTERVSAVDENWERVAATLAGGTR